MTIQELSVRFDNIARDINYGPVLGDIMTGAASMAHDLIYMRVHGSGVNAEGQKYISPSGNGTSYSTKEMLIGCKGFKNTANCSRVFGKKKNKELKWVTLDKTGSNGKKIRLAVLDGGYKKFRELNDLQSGFVDFAFSNRMWTDITVKKDRNELNRGIARIGAIHEEEQKKLEGNTGRFGEILMLSQKEIGEVSDFFNGEIDKILRKQGL